MKLVVGLGNPGRKYAASRHNVGFRIVERFAAEGGVPLTSHRFEGRFGRGRVHGHEVTILEPETFMNLSGASVAEALRTLPIDDVRSDVLVVLDDLDLPFGRLRIRTRGGAGGHKGLADVLECVGRDDIPRLRFGIGRPPNPAMDPIDYVLQPFAPEEEAKLPGRIDAASRAVLAVVADGVAAAMDLFNRPPEP